MNDIYVRTVRLLLDVAPTVFANQVFAMKGGTALNLFVQDMPRLSVDIHVVFTPRDTPRDEALKAIGEQLHSIREQSRAWGTTWSLRGRPKGTTRSCSSRPMT